MPAGNKVTLPGWPTDRACELLDEYFGSFRRHYFESGTAALAAALVAVLDQTSKHRRRVLLPAYGCPSLVAAAIYAGGEVTLVDTRGDDWGLAREDFARKLDERTAAVVFVDLLGLGDDFTELSALARQAGAAVIQDSAQHMPIGSVGDWQADVVVLSFGRGKPINLLGGGALLFRDHEFLKRITKRLSSARRAAGSLRWRMAGTAFNAFGDRIPYRLLRRLGIAHVGDTRYSAVSRAAMIEPGLDSVLAPALAAYSRRRAVDEADLRLEGVCYRQLKPKSSLRRVLRIPVMASNESARDRAIAVLESNGFGATDFYGRPMCMITGMPESVRRQTDVPGAGEFARRLLTLPAHDRVRVDHLGAMRALLTACIGLEVA